MQNWNVLIKLKVNFILPYTTLPPTPPTPPTPKKFIPTPSLICFLYIIFFLCVWYLCKVTGHGMRKPVLLLPPFPGKMLSGYIKLRSISISGLVFLSVCLFQLLSVCWKFSNQGSLRNSCLIQDCFSERILSTDLWLRALKNNLLCPLSFGLSP